MNEQEWMVTAVVQTLKGDDAAFTPLVEFHQGAIFNLCYRMLNDAGEAEDAAQETFLRAYTQLRRFDQARSFKTWLFSIAHHYCIDRIRKRHYFCVSIDDPLPPHPALHDATVGPEEATIRGEQTVVFQKLLAKLSPEDRGVVIMRYWYDMSYEEIAEAVHNTVSSVKSRLHRARGQLATWLAAYPNAQPQWLLNTSLA